MQAPGLYETAPALNLNRNFNGDFDGMKPMRSLLFVPADSPRKLEKSLRAGADALIIDLEDSVAPDSKARARERAAAFLREERERAGGPALIVRVNALDSGLIDQDLDAIVREQPHAIMLPKACGGPDVQHLSIKIAVREAECDIPDGTIRIIPIVTESARALFELGSYRGASQRLTAMTWGAEDLATDLGAETNRLDDGSYTPAFALARALTLCAAASAGVDAIDTIFADFRDSAAFRRECRAARRDGFSGKMAIHPDQVAIINDLFQPSPDEVARAQRIVSAFQSNPQAGVLALDGAMIDRPHLVKAQRLLARHKS